MVLISQPGSDYQIVSISLDAGYTRDLILMLIDVHAVLDHLYLDGTQPEITSPAEDYLRESASPYSLPALIDALGEVTDQLSRGSTQSSLYIGIVLMLVVYFAPDGLVGLWRRAQSRCRSTHVSASPKSSTLSRIPARASRSNRESGFRTGIRLPSKI